MAEALLFRRLYCTPHYKLHYLFTPRVTCRHDTPLQRCGPKGRLNAPVVIRDYALRVQRGWEATGEEVDTAMVADVQSFMRATRSLDDAALAVPVPFHS